MIENGFQEPLQWRNIHNQNKSHFPEIPLFHYSLACNHCTEAPCMQNCPANAYSRDENTGAVIFHAEKCIGCKYCTWACPFDAPKFNPNKGIIEKCTFCNHRIEEGKKPACANSCPTGALDFSGLTLSDEDSVNSSPVPVFVGSRLKSIEPRRKNGPLMESNKAISKYYFMQTKPGYKKIDASKEWPLLLFTLLASVVVGFKSSMLTFGNDNYLWLGLFAVGALISTAHLGRKTKAWRAVLNLRNSWLSREIAAYALFGFLLTIDAFLIHVSIWLFALVGFGLLLCIDMLYHLATWQWPVKLHSAQTIFITLSLIALIQNCLVCLAILALFRFVLWIFHLKNPAKANLPVQIFRWLMLLFTVVGLLLQLPFIVLLIVFLSGELLDRICFYNQLNVPSPQNDLSYSKN
jgi:Fe-S-cluster-containing dehydrogenase component/DMSO reductase anchor subunit